MSTCVDKSWLEAHPDFWARLKAAMVGSCKDRAHPYPPGTGPKGQSCGTCAKLVAKTCRKNYFKCHVMRGSWTSGLGTDVRKKDPACLAWEPRIDKVEVVTTRWR